MIQGVHISTSTIQTSCKITTQQQIKIGDEFHVSFSFGTGMKKFCMTASNRKPREIYIDRVERNNLCVKGGIIDDEGTSKLVQLGLYFIKTRMPFVERFTLQDDSYAYCIKDATNGKKVSMTYESIMKYNQTWYQQKCGARLPGMISVHDQAPSSSNYKIISCIAGTKTGKSIVYRTLYYEVLQDSMMEQYLESLMVLDQPIMSYEIAVEHFPTLERYRNDYIASSTPREFITHIRNRMPIEEYCMEVNGWFEGYMTYLNIIIFKEKWFIPIESVSIPIGYKEEDMTEKDKQTTFYGGKKSKTRKANHTTWRMQSGMRTGYAVGFIQDI
jgi:hypothetical protein